VLYQLYGGTNIDTFAGSSTVSAQVFASRTAFFDLPEPLFDTLFKSFMHRPFFLTAIIASTENKCGSSG